MKSLSLGIRLRIHARRLGSALRSAFHAAPVVTVAMALGVVLVARRAWIQLSSLNLPIFGFDGHHWRQSFTFSVAWNYAHTTLDILRPRMFLELKSSNIVAMEAPVYPLVASVLLRLGNDSIVGPRLVSWLSLVVSAVVLFRLLGIGRSDPRDAWADRAGLLVALGVSVMIGTEFRSVQPEPMSAGLSMLAAWFFIRYRDSEQQRDAILGAIATTLAVLTKPLVLGIVPALVLFAMWGSRRSLRRGLTVVAAILPGLILYAAWDRWAAKLVRTEMNGMAIISIEHHPAEMIRNLRNLGFAREAIFHFLPDYAGSWWLTPALVLGIFRALSEPRLRRFGVPFAVWLVGYLVELLAFGDRLHSNAYYFILAPLPVAFFCAVGLGGLVRALDSSTRRPPITAFRVGLALAVLLPLGALVAKSSSWSSIEVKDLGFERNRALWTDDIGLAKILVVALLAIAIAPSLRPRRVPKWLGVVVLFAVMASGVVALRDAEQYFRFYTSTGKRGRFSEEVTALRKVVDTYSSVNDRIVMNGDEIVWFNYALRNGFSSAQAKTPAGLAELRARGARLYVHVDSWGGPKTAPEVSGTLLEAAAWWRVYCIDEHGCAATGKAR